MDYDNPYQLLSTIELSIKQLSSKRDAASMYQENWQGVYFQSGNRCFLTSILQIHEVIHSTNILALAHVQPWLKGVIQLRGELILVNDLSTFLFKEPVEIDRKSRILVAEHQNEKTGFLLNKVFGTVTIQDPQLIPVESKWERFFPFISQAIVHDDMTVLLLDFQALMSHPSLLTRAPTAA